MIQLSKLSLLEQSKWKKKYIKWYRERTKGIKDVSGMERERLRNLFIDYHNLIQ